MSEGLKNTIIFAVGAALGSAVTYKLVKDKYERIAQEEIAEMREYYRKKHEPMEEEFVEPEESIVKITEADKRDYASIVSRYANDISEITEKGGVEAMEDEDDDDKPFVIPPEDFGEIEDYDTQSLTYYSDGVLEDDQGNIIENPSDLVGDNIGDHFGEFEEDAVHVRNDKYHTYYEVLMDIRTYADANSINSHKDDE